VRIETLYMDEPTCLAAWECFDTLGFFCVQEHKPSPRPPICSLEWYRLALPYT
jgi:hypothetical protein